MHFDKIPTEMTRYNQWIVWRLEDLDSKKPTKTPYCPHTGRLASVTNPDNWGTFEQAKHVLETTNVYDGLGFVLTEADPYAFIDLDDTNGDQSARYFAYRSTVG